MKHLKVGKIKKLKLSKRDKRTLQKFMNSEYVFSDKEGDNVYMMFEGYDHMTQEWRIIKINKAVNHLMNMDGVDDRRDDSGKSEVTNED